MINDRSMPTTLFSLCFHLSLQVPHGCSSPHQVLRARHWLQEAQNIESWLDFIILLVVEIRKMEEIDCDNTFQKITPWILTLLLENQRANEVSLRPFHYHTLWPCKLSSFSVVPVAYGTITTHLHITHSIYNYNVLLECL